MIWVVCSRHLYLLQLNIIKPFKMDDVRAALAEVGVQGFGALGSATLKSLGNLRGGRGVGVQRYSGYADYSASARKRRSHRERPSPEPAPGDDIPVGEVIEENE